MPPIEQAMLGATGQRAGGVTTFADLPPDLLPNILRHLERGDRRLAAGVNRRWHDAAHAPELCRDVAIVSQNPGRELASLLPWLRRHGRHVRCLTLQMYGPLEEQDQQLLHGCLAACAAVGQLESLAVKALRHWDPLEVGAWVQALPRLQSLALNSDSVHLTSSLHQLPALRRLALEVDHNSTGEGLLRLGAGVRLPPQLEELELTLNWHVLLPQVAGLSHLHTLALTGANNTTAGAGIVDQLPRLRRLHLKKLPVLPEWLPGCQALEELVLNSVRNCDADSLDAALRELTGLTKLEILDMAAAATPPAAIASLPRLRSARFRPYEVRHLPPTALPMGPWAGRLQHLGASYGTLLLSGELLAAAGQLRELTIHGDGSLAQPSAASERFWWWCAVHPPLQKLRIEAREYTQFAAIVLKAILQLQRAWTARQADIELRY